MRIKIFFALAITTLLALSSPVRAGVKASESFDSTNFWGALPWGSFTNTATNTIGWVVNNGRIMTPALSPPALSLPYSCLMRGSNSTTTAYKYSIDSPSLSNGVGSVVFSARLYDQNFTNQIVVESRTGGGAWTVQGATNNIVSTNWGSFTNVVMSNSDLTISLRKLNNTSPSSAVYIDNIAVTYPPATLSSTLTSTPTIPTANNSIAVTASLSVSGYPDALYATNYWRSSASTNWTPIPMAATNQFNIFTTITNMPAQTTFSSIDYYARITQVSGIGGFITNIFTTSETNTVTVKPQSDYTNMVVVTSPFNANLSLSSDFFWQGVAYVSNSPSAFQFQGTSNGTPTLWGDSNQAISNLLAYGNGDIGATNILLSTTNIGLHLFTFNETDASYSARACVRENFETWANQSFGTTTNQWILTNGSVTNDASGAYSGRYATLESNTTSSLLSPLLTNGIGHISFWYRKWGTSGGAAGALDIQIAPTPASTNWTTITSLTNITSTSYSFINIPWADLNNQAIRILNNTNAGHARISLDEVVVAAPGAAVRGSSLTNSPASPSSLDTVNIDIILETNAWATLTNVVVWYRGATNLLFESLPLVQSNNNHYITTNGIPPIVGTVQYAVEYRYSGVLGKSPVFYPSAGTNQPYSYTSTNTMPTNYRFESFDLVSEWGVLPWGSFTNTATNTIGWVVNNGRIMTPALSLPYSCLMKGSTSTTTAFDSPSLSNGVGSVVFSARLYDQNFTNQIVVESRTGGGAWTVQGATNNIVSTNWGSFTNVVMSNSDLTISLRKLNNTDPSRAVYIDNIYCTPYPADIAITNITFNPGYPAMGQSITASCDILSLTAQYPAFNITPTFYWSPYPYSLTNSIPMTHASGNTFTTAYSFSLTNVTRDLPVKYWVQSAFAGYHAIPDDDLSPRVSPTNTFLVRAYASSYQDLGVIVNGSLKSGRLLADGVWQAFFTVSSSSNLSFMLNGSGYSAGTGYSTNATQWGNTTNWQTTTTPLVDLSYTGQASFAISGSSNAFSGQYVLRFDERTGQYIILKCVSQDFDGWTSDDDLFKFESKASSSLLQNNFNDWTTNSTQTRVENFSDPRWGAINYYTNYAAAGPVGYGIFVSKISGSAMVTTNPASLIGGSFVVQGSQLATELSTQPLKGIGTISFKYNCSAITNNTIGVYLYTNAFSTPDEYALSSRWIPLTNSTISNTTVATYTVNLKTSAPADVIIAHTAGKATVTFDDLTVSEWYADSQTKSSWVTSEGWIEQRAGITEDNYCLRFDTSRADSGSEEFVMTPMLSNGVGAISFDYCCASSNTPVSFTIASRTGLFGTWINLVTTNASGFNGTATDYRTYSFLVNNPATNTFLKIVHTNLTQGILLIDNIKITGTSVSSAWEINNTAIDDSPHPSPPLTLGKRQFYAGFSTLNKDRTSNLASGSFFPNTNTWPYIVSPILSTGIGEISFWYRNWTTNGAVTPARLIIQTTTNILATTNDTIWSTVAIVSNIVNTNDYQYYQYIGNNTASRYARIYNDDQYTSAVGRVCIDDILVAEPLAATLSMSNLVITPTIPLYTNTVKIATDIYKLFLAPSNITLTAYYATATTYAALSGATPVPLGMSCISTNPSAPGQWYRYQTTNAIPTNAIDTFVKYYVQASYQGYQAASTSPKTNSSFPTYPAWYAPMDTVYTNGIAYYVVYSCPTGAVWINEFTPVDFDGDNLIFTNEFVELCGPNGVNIRNWMLEFMNISTKVSSYTITNNPILHSPTNGYGFWVLAVTNNSAFDQALTTTVADDPPLSGSTIGPQKMPGVGGIQLKRSWGAAEQSIFYNTDIGSVPSGYVLVGSHPNNILTGGGSLGLTGTGTNYVDFSWQELTTATAGSMNEGQTLVAFVIQGTPPVVYIYSVKVNSNVWIECTQATNWFTYPWYTTNLVASNSWTVVPSFNRSTSGSNDLLNFILPTNSKAYFYKVISTNAP